MKKNFTKKITVLIRAIFLVACTVFTLNLYTQNANLVKITNQILSCGDTLWDSRDGKPYKTVQIGPQCWMAENLNVGSRIDSLVAQSNNGVIEKHCYNDSEDSCTIYGAFYVWNEMMNYYNTPGIQGICPDGWHIPTEEEWCSMLRFIDTTITLCDNPDNLGVDAGGKIKEAGYAHWMFPNTGATNASGFTGLGQGYYWSVGGRIYYDPFISETWWTSSLSTASTAWAYWVSNQSSQINKYNGERDIEGYAVRCVEGVGATPISFEDLNILNIVNPVSGCELGTEAISVLMRNDGPQPITNPFIINYTINGGSSISETISNSLQPGDSLLFTFSISSDFPFAIPDSAYEIVAYVDALAADTNQKNDTTYKTIVSTYIPPEPIGINDTVPGGMAANLSATSSFIPYWYENPIGGLSIANGLNFTTPVLWDTSIYYVEALTSTLSHEALIGDDNYIMGVDDYPSPYCVWYYGNRNQFLIHASELHATGMTAGPITSVSFNTIVPAAMSMSNFYIKVGHTTESNLYDWVTGLTEYYFNSSFSDVVGWNEHVFSTPFLWDGVSNIVIETCFNNDSYESGGQIEYSIVNFYASINNHDDDYGVCTDTYVYDYYYDRPNMKLLAQGGEYCPSNRVPVYAYVTGSPEISASDTCLYFSPTLIGNSEVQEMYIYNTGSYALTINNVSNALPDYTYSLSSNYIIPGDSSLLTITFSPLTSGLKLDNFSIHNNDSLLVICVEGMGLEPPVLSVNPDSIYSIESCFDTAYFPISIINSGLGDGIFEFIVLQDYDSTSIVHWNTSGASTFHTFTGISPYTDTLVVSITINGDYNSTSEYASIYFDGIWIAQMNGGYNNTDITETFTITGPQLNTFLADGTIVVEVENSSGVNPNAGTDDHTVNVMATYELHWLNPIPQSDTVLANDSLTAVIEVYTSLLNAGVYSENLIIETNDPQNPVINIPFIIDVQGDPEIVLPGTCIVYDSTFQWLCSSEIVEIVNIGCDTLFVDTTYNTLSEFSTGLFNPFYILPGDTVFITVNFCPTLMGDYVDTVWMNTNDGLVNICLKGYGIGSPVLEVTPDTLIGSASCNDSTTVTMLLENTGLNELIYSFDAPCSWIIIEINTSSSAYVIEWELKDGFGNPLLSGTGYSNYSTYYDSICLPAGQYSFVYNSVYGSWYGGTYSVSACNSVIINNGGASPTSNGQESFLFTGCGFYASWITVSKYIDTIPIGSSDTVVFTFNSESLNAGVHEADILIHSNETPDFQDTVHCIFSVSGNSLLAVYDTCVMFGSVMQWDTGVQSSYIFNIGCDTLWITNFVNSLPEFSVNSNIMYVLPGDSLLVEVSFNPTTNDNFYDTLYINTNGGSASLCLHGYAPGAPIINVDPVSYNFTFNSCNDSLVVPLNIFNTGLGNLFFEINSDASSGGGGGDPPKVLLLSTGNGATFKNYLVNTGKFGASDIDVFTQNPTTLSVTDLEPYDVVMVWSSNSWNASQLVGDVLKQYADNMGNVIICTYSVTTNWGLTGGIFDPGYCPFLPAGTQNVSGVLDISSLTDPSHPVFENITNDFTYWKNSNYSNPNLNTGGILLASDTWGNNMVAENQDGSVLGIVAYPPNQSGYPDAMMMYTNALYYAGKKANWISFSLTQDTLGILDTSYISVQFNTTGLVNGQYIADIVITSNDPLAPVVIVPCTLNINSSPIIDVTPTVINFDSTMQWTSRTDTLRIFNHGCDTLHITDIINTLPEFSATPITLSILPELYADVVVTFTPATQGTFIDTLNIINNDTLVQIIVDGVGFGAPIASVNPSSFSVNFTTCSDTIILPLTINNNGSEILDWSLSGGATSTLDSTQTQNYFVSGAVTNHTFSNLSAYSDSIKIIVSLNGDFDSQSEYATLTIDGDYIGIIPDGNPPNGTEIVVSYMFYGIQMLNWLADGQITITISNSSGVNTFPAQNYHKVRFISYGSDWISFNPEFGSIPYPSSTITNVYFISTGLSSGLYQTNIILNSNDPLNPQILIPVDLTLSGYPIISSSTPCVEFDSLNIGLSTTDTFSILNIGCDTLFVSNITNALSEFSVDQTNFYILPGWSKDLVVTFSPNTINTFLDTFHIINNDAELLICIEGDGIGIPVFQTNNDTLIFNVNGCVSTDSLKLVISNPGTLDLTWNSTNFISSSLSDDFDPGIDASQWTSIMNGTAAAGCGAVSSPNALYFNGSGVREAITKDMSTLGGGEISFYLKIGSGSFPCENADGGEDIGLQYSTDGGLTWNTINIYNTESFPVFTLIQENIPLAAEATNCRFRWYQFNHSGSGYDNWAIDDVEIITTSFSVILSQNSGILNPSDSSVIYVTAIASGLNAGSYETLMTFLTNDPFQPTYILTIIMNINIVPLVANAGPDEVINSGGSVILNATATGGLAPYTYNWAPTSTLDNPNIASPTANPLTTTVYSVTVVGSTGCVSVDEVEVAVRYSINGTITYLNSNSEPISNSWAILMNSSQVKIDSALTDQNGNYQFDFLDNGNYYLGLNSTIAWGGANATDALAVQRHVVMLEMLTGLPLVAADVNASTTITSLDALFILRRFVGFISSFPAGDWASSLPMVTISDSNEVADYKTLCFGDVNGSHIINPTKSLQPTVRLLEEEDLIISDHNKFTLPLRISRETHVGAITLGLTYPTDKLLFESLNSSTDGWLYNDQNGTIKMAWEDVNAKLFGENEAIVNLEFLMLEGEKPPYNFGLLPQSEFADMLGNVYKSVELKIPVMSKMEEFDKFYLGINHPNPFSQITQIDYYLPEDGHVILEIHDAIGQSVKTLVNVNQEKGHYSVEFDGSQLSQGIYIYSIRIITESNAYSNSRKMYLLR